MSTALVFYTNGTEDIEVTATVDVLDRGGVKITKAAVTEDGSKVKIRIGSEKHPTVTDHYIEWISIDTKEGIQRKDLSPESEPEAVFFLGEDDELINAYAYCNLHGLWKTEL